MKIDKPGIGLPARGQRLDLLVGRLFIKREERLEILLRAHIIPWKHLNPPETSQQHIFYRPTAYRLSWLQRLARNARPADAPTAGLLIQEIACNFE